MNNYYGESWQDRPLKRNITVAQVNAFMRMVFFIMAAGLAITGLTSYLFADLITNNPAKYLWMFTGGFRWVLILAPVAISLMLTAMINRISFVTANLMFAAYAFLLGVSLSVIFLIYTGASIATTFFITAGMFGGLAFYGLFTKSDLTSIGTYFGMALWGLILMSLVNMFMQSPTMHYIIGGLGVIIFSGLTAYDVQKLQQIGFAADMDSEDTKKQAVIGGLILYTDFINLFLMLLRFFGDRRD